MTNLLPCPFCDTTAVSIKKVKGGYIALCELSTPRAMLNKKGEHCEVGNVCTDVFKNPEDAAEQWNWRLK